MKEQPRKTLDQMGRPVRDLRISLIDRCNLRCTYCMPKEIFGPDYVFLRKSEWLGFEELTRTVAALVDLGVTKVRLTGGEPLLRPDLVSIVKSLRAMPGIEDLALTTNGVRLAEMAENLYRAGLDRVTVSLDALDSELTGTINGRGVGSQVVLDGIKAALQWGMRVKLNTVVERCVNEGEILPLAHMAKSLGVEIRFIEFMDVGNHNGWSKERVVSGQEILEILRQDFDLQAEDLSSSQMVAKTYRHRDGSGKIGLITSVSQPFCGNCTRLRLSTDGKLYTCLFASTGHDLRQFLREKNPSDEDLRHHLAKLWRARSDRYSEIRQENTLGNPKIEMFYIGG